MTKKQVAPAEPERSFSIEVATLRSALKDVTGVVETRNTIPVLSNVLLVVTPEALTITGSDLDVQVERHVALQQADAFTITVEAAVLARIAGKLPADATARFALADGKIGISAGRSRFSLPTLPATDFPSISAGATVAEFVMPAAALLEAIGTVSHAISTEETRYYLNGIFVHAPDGGDLRLATTDGHRLARVVLPLPEGAVGLPDIIVPRKLIKLMAGVLATTEGEVEIGVSDRKICVGVGATTITGKLIDGTYPDYTRVIPTGNEGQLSIDRDALIGAIARVATVASDKTKAVRAELAHDVLTLTVSSPENGIGTEEVACSWTAAPLTIGFNSKFLLDTLAHLTADTIEAWFADAAAPTLWRDREDASAAFVVMPMRV